MPVEKQTSFSINIRELKEIANRLLDHIEQVEGTDLELSVDYYWHIPKEQAYNPLTDPDPSDFTMGQLTDDWQELRKFLSQEEYEPIPYGLVWLSAILRAVGEHVKI